MAAAVTSCVLSCSFWTFSFVQASNFWWAADEWMFCASAGCGQVLQVVHLQMAQDQCGEDSDLPGLLKVLTKCRVDDTEVAGALAHISINPWLLGSGPMELVTCIAYDPTSIQLEKVGWISGYFIYT